MNYSRLFQFTPASTNGGVTLEPAVPGTNDDDAHLSLFDSLKAVFHTHPRRQFGMFDAESPRSAFAAAVGDYQSQTIDTDELGLKLAQKILAEMNSVEKPQPWYLWLISDQGGDGKVIYLFLLKHDEVHHISAQQTVTTGRTIQPTRLQYAVKLSVSEWQSAQSKTYLSYLAPKNKDPITLIWNELIGFSEGADRSTQTEEFLTVVERYAEKLPPEQEQEYRTRVVNYCLDQDRAGEPVEIQALSRHVDEAAPEALMNFYTEHYEEPTTPLYTDRKQLKRYTRFFGRDNDLSIGFSTLMLGRDIIYDESSGTLTIRVIPKSLKSQLARHVKKAE